MVAIQKTIKCFLEHFLVPLILVKVDESCQRPKIFENLASVNKSKHFLTCSFHIYRCVTCGESCTAIPMHRIVHMADNT